MRDGNRKHYRVLSVLPVVLLSLACEAGCGLVVSAGVPAVEPEVPNVVSLDPQNWYILYSAGMPLHPSADPEGAWSLEFPNAADGGHVNYVQTPFNATITPSQVAVTFKVESTDAQYVVTDANDKPPATVRLFFEQQGDDLQDPNGRWWAQSSMYDLGSQDGQTLTITVPLTFDKWSNVDGKFDAQAFSEALKNVGWVGMTFGGQYFAGHGAAVSSGSAKYILIAYDVN